MGRGRTRSCRGGSERPRAEVYALAVDVQGSGFDVLERDPPKIRDGSRGDKRLPSEAFSHDSVRFTDLGFETHFEIWRNCLFACSDALVLGK